MYMKLNYFSIMTEIAKEKYNGNTFKLARPSSTYSPFLLNWGLWLKMVLKNLFFSKKILTVPVVREIKQ